MTQGGLPGLLGVNRAALCWRGFVQAACVVNLAAHRRSCALSIGL